MNETKELEAGIRDRVLEAIEEIKERGSRDNVSYAAIMRSLDDVQQVHSQLKLKSKRYPKYKHIILLHKVYGYRLEYLMLGTGKKRETKGKKNDPIDMLEMMEMQISNMKKEFKNRQ